MSSLKPEFDASDGGAFSVGQGHETNDVGFDLIDRNFLLRHDAAGHHPVDGLYRDLLPALGDYRLIDRRNDATGRWLIEWSVVASKACRFPDRISAFPF